MTKPPSHYEQIVGEPLTEEERSMVDRELETNNDQVLREREESLPIK